ncbi:hypothetical protein COOONC_18738, partial [Cooperia oncophora]
MHAARITKTQPDNAVSEKGHNHPDHHISERSAHESAEHAHESAEEEGDADSVNEIAPDNELQEIMDEPECSEDKNKGEEEGTVEENKHHAKLSLKDQQHDHKVGKRSAYGGEAHGHHSPGGHHPAREKRSESGGDSAEGNHEDPTDVEDYSSDHEHHDTEHAKRKRRDTDEEPDHLEHHEHPDGSHE